MDKEPPEPPTFLPRLGDDKPEDRPQRKWESLFYPDHAPPRPEAYDLLLAEFDRHKAYMRTKHPESIEYDDARRQKIKARLKIMALVDVAKASRGNGLSPEDKAKAEQAEEERYQARKQALDAEQEEKVAAARERARKRREKEELEQAGRESTEAAETDQDRAAARIGKALREEFEKHGDKVVRLRPVDKERDEQTPPADWRRFLRWADDLHAMDVGDIPFRVSELLPRVWLSLLNGDGGAGKTTLLTQLFSCLSEGKPLFGRACLPTKVMLFSSEEDDEVAARRLSHMPDIARFPVFNLLEWPSGTELCWTRRDGVVAGLPFLDVLREIIGDMRPEMVGLDHVGDFFMINENSKTEVNAALQLLRPLHAEFGVDFILTQHISKAGMLSGRRDAGTPQWHNKSRWRAALYPPGLDEDAAEDEVLRSLAEQARVFEIMKDNYGGTAGTVVPLLRNGWSFVQEKGEVRRAKERSLADGLAEFVTAARRGDAGVMWPANPLAGGSLVSAYRGSFRRGAPAYKLVVAAVEELERSGVVVRSLVRNRAGEEKPYLAPA